MTDLLRRAGVHRVPARTSWLDDPLSGWWCAVGWLGGTVIFVAVVRHLNGPTQADSVVSVFSTWAIAHGQWACAYPPNLDHSSDVGRAAFGTTSLFADPLMASSSHGGRQGSQSLV